MNRLDIISSTDLLKEHAKPVLEDDWLPAGAYFGWHGASNWRKLETSDDATGNRTTHRNRVIKSVIELLAKNQLSSRFEAVVSFGPGTGLLDEQVLDEIRNKQLLKWSPGTKLPYIPIDVSAGCLLFAWEVLHVEWQIRHAILGNFAREAGWCFTQLESVFRDIKSEGPRLILCLGNTIGNFQQEGEFCNALAVHMRDEDVCLMELTCRAKDGYIPHQDPHSGHMLESEIFKSFVSYALIREDASAQVTVTAVGLPGDDGQASSHLSSVPNTITFRYSPTTRSGNVLLVHRYHPDEIQTWLTDRGFRWIERVDPPMPNYGGICHTVFMLRKSKPRD